MGSHSVTCHPTQVIEVNAPLTPASQASQAGTQFTYPGGMEDWVDLGSLTAARPEIEPTTLDRKSDALTVTPPTTLRRSFLKYTRLLVITIITQACLWTAGVSARCTNWPLPKYMGSWTSAQPFRRNIGYRLVLFVIPASVLAQITPRHSFSIATFCAHSFNKKQHKKTTKNNKNKEIKKIYIIIRSYTEYNEKK